MKHKHWIVWALLLFLLLGGCVPAVPVEPAPPVPVPEPVIPEPEPAPAPAPAPAPEPVPEPVPEPEPEPDRFAVLGIPEEVGETYYTQQVREIMLQQGMDYQTVESLIDAGYVFAEMVEMTHEQRKVCGFADRYGYYDGGLPELLTVLPKTEAYMTERYADRIKKISYGTSKLGRSLDAYVLSGTEPARQTVMLTFAIHGYEGADWHDGAYLTDNAYMLMQFYALNPEFLGETRLVFCPMLNPDGVYAESKSSYGRTQSDGIDMNRDFHRNGFRAAESIALREFIEEMEPDILIDFHGWLNGTYGDTGLAEIFREYTGLSQWDKNYGSSQGYLIGYAHKQGIRALLVEHERFTEVQARGLLYALNRICKIE